MPGKYKVFNVSLRLAFLPGWKQHVRHHVTLKLSTETETNEILLGSAALKDTTTHCNY